ncbi:MAG: trypsin-like serine protease, partial [Gemmatimonadota bacterium]
MRHRALTASALALGLLLALGACGDDTEPPTGTDPDEPELVTLFAQGTFGRGSAAAELVIEVTADDLDEPVRESGPVDDHGHVRVELSVPEGADRTFSAFAVDASGGTTHGKFNTVVDYIETTGTGPGTRSSGIHIELPLEPAVDTELAAEAVVASYLVTVEPSEAQLTAGETIQLDATVVDAAGDPVPDADPAWASGYPALAQVDDAGFVEATLVPGLEGTTRTVRIVASYEGMSDMAELTITYPEDDVDEFGLERLAEILSSDDPPLREQIGDHIIVQTLDPGELVDGGPDMPLVVDRLPNPGSGTAEPPPEDAVYDAMTLHAFNSRTLHQFEIRIAQPLLDDVHALRARHGLVGATEGVDDGDTREGGGSSSGPASGSDPGVSDPLGWSDGVDTRIVRTATTTWPWRAIAQFTYGGTDSRCTGTLIGPRHVITAAHCINEFGTNKWFTTTVAPARNGEDILPFGSSTIKLNPDPGTEAWYFTPAPWRDSTTADRWQWDWGMIVIPDRLGDQTGWMGYVARPFGDLDGVNNFNRGYPSCQSDYAERPADCEPARLYGDTELCGPGDVYFPGGDGWNRMISVGCDLSRGHSGSPVYHYFFDQQLGKSVPVVSMVVSFHQCLTCGEDAGFPSYPNFARRITPGALGVISALRQT